MTHLLIIDSNTPDINAAHRAAGREIEGDNYARVMRGIDAGITCDVIEPYARTVRVEHEPYDGVICTGSAVAWCVDDPRTEPLAETMRDVFAQGIPTFGSCNGMQLAAQILGGMCGAAPLGREDGTAHDIALSPEGKTHPMMAGRDDTYHAPCLHRDQVQLLPKWASLLAGNGHSLVQAFAYDHDGVIFWGTQYHPEYAPDYLSALLSSKGLTATPPDDDPAYRQIELVNWLKMVQSNKYA